MNALKTESCWSPLKRRFLMGALLLGVSGSQMGCGCECAGVAGVIGLATPIILLGRELQEAKKMVLEIERPEDESQRSVDSR
ncbi:MAG: hypothetical protein ACK526_13470 [Planctomyces sp.]